MTCNPMGNVAEKLNLGKCVLPPDPYNNQDHAAKMICDEIK